MNAPYTAPWAFDNDFPAVGTELDKESAEADARDSGKLSALFRSEPVAGRCRVLCYHPNHNKTLADMTEQEALAVVQLWASEVGALRQSHQWVQVFENRGEIMGCSNAHPHGQIWAVDTLPNEGAKELAQQQALFDAEEEALLEIYRAEEERLEERLVIQENHWTAIAIQGTAVSGASVGPGLMRRTCSVTALRWVTAIGSNPETWWVPSPARPVCRAG